LRPGGGKAKGSAFEREVCKKLSLWLSAGRRDDLLWRSAMSGGRATVRFKQGSTARAQAGDISAIHPLGAILTSRYVIEVKSYRTLNIAASVYRYEEQGIPKGRTLAAFWWRCLHDAKKYDCNPLLIAKENRHAPFVCMTEEDLHAFELEKHTIANFYPANCHLVPFDAFLIFAKQKVLPMPAVTRISLSKRSIT
jgi:hypothetical protein